MRHLVIGDIHGNLRALEQVLDRSNFDQENDVLIGIGDYCDGHAQSAEVVEFLIGLPNFIGIMGNHDEWVRDWLKFGVRNDMWIPQGGQATVESYIKTQYVTKDSHKAFFDDLHYYYILELEGKRYAFVHGGYQSRDGLGNDRLSTYTWDRKLWDMTASKGCIEYTDIRTKMYDLVFIGHTSTYFDHPEWSKNPPIQRSRVVNLDQGAGYDGYLTLCDVQTLECWQSDSGVELYGKYAGR